MISRIDIEDMTDAQDEARLEAAEVALSQAIYRQTEGEWQPNTRQAYELVQVVVTALAAMDTPKGGGDEG